MKVNGRRDTLRDSPPRAPEVRHKQGTLETGCQPVRCSFSASCASLPLSTMLQKGFGMISFLPSFLDKWDLNLGMQSTCQASSNRRQADCVGSSVQLCDRSTHMHAINVVPRFALHAYQSCQRSGF